MLDEAVIWINDQQFWLYAAADPDTNELFYVCPFDDYHDSTKIVLRELRYIHDVETAIFLVNGAQHP